MRRTLFLTAVAAIVLSGCKKESQFICEEEVVVGLPAEFFKPAAGREGAESVAHVRGNRFVERHPQRNFIFERLE